jgi:hypothetical protein
MTRSLELLVPCFVSILGLAGCALPGGPGDFDRPARASSMRASFVRYYDECREASLDTGLGVYGCPVTAPSSYEFGPDGACSIRATGVEEECYLSDSGSCADVHVEVRCSDVRDVTYTPVAAPGWQLAVKYRATMAAAGGDMTIVDASIGLDLDADAGTLSLDDTAVNEFLANAYGAAAAGYRGPLNVQILGAKILDPESNTFAVMGFASN